jgi:hypothetical protein
MEDLERFWRKTPLGPLGVKWKKVCDTRKKLIIMLAWNWKTSILIVAILCHIQPLKFQGHFGEYMDLKYVLIDMWANDQNEMMLFYFQL